MKISDAPQTADIAGMLQRTDAWYSDRCGKVTASPILKVYKKLKSGGYSSERETYFYQVLGEVLTGAPAAGTPSLPACLPSHGVGPPFHWRGRLARSAEDCGPC